ncbi:hypothetical protein JK364_23575 [Streptomyces sp. 110]|uniref:Uncharacterized protein n=1 Tax=Streptomyces endocoffeicus TaxID=2898945 RepID=A0ABS1PSE4_9ACTN|nr:hypothetical protein [Streptomyces endocoffeicus]MBL1115354.1 hypothetical protein [Streptomyces endocoffeicus]
MSAITTAPAQVGNGKAVHYVRKDAFHSYTIGCGRLVSRELTAQEAADRKACGPCKRAVEVLATEPPAETEAPAAPAEDDQATKVADIERRVRPLDADTVTAATMFDPELTYYADGTRVVMRAQDAERTGTTFGMAHGAAAYAYQAVCWVDGGADLVAPHVLHRADQDDQARRQELVTEVAARTLVLASHATAHVFQPVDLPDGERIAWTFRTGHGARARYHWVSVCNIISQGDGSEYRWQADQAARLARRTGLDQAPMPEYIALVTAEPTDVLERVAATLDPDTVKLKEDGPGCWVVKRGGAFLGSVRDEGARMRRGRYAAWAPYAERRDGKAGFHHDLDAAKDAVAQAWPVEVAEIAGELGVPVTQVMEVAEQVDQDWKAQGRRAVLRAEAYAGTDSRVTQAAAAEVRRRLEVPFHGPADYDGPTGLCGYDDHTAPLLSSGKLAQHDRQQGVMWACPGSCRPGRGIREELTMRDTTAVFYNPPRPRGLACHAKDGDLVVVDGQAMEVKGLQADKGINAHAWLVLDGVSAGPLRFTLEDRLEYRRRVRRVDVACRECCMYVVMEVDEAVDGVPNTRLCGLCDRPQPGEMTEDQARARVANTYPRAEAFQAERTEHGRLTGYTFRAGRLHSARYGWITAAGTYAQALEDYRSQAAAMLPMAVRDEQAARP